jgi:hypothetical protein
VTHAKLYIVGRLYDIPALEEYALEHYAEECDKSDYLEIPHGFVETARLIYENISNKDDRFGNSINLCCSHLSQSTRASG